MNSGQAHHTGRNSLHEIVFAAVPSLLKRANNPRVFALLEAGSAAAANFAVSIVIARTYDSEVFSGYLTALSAAFIVIAFLRVSFSMPSAVKPDTWYRRKLPALVAVHVTAIAIGTALATALLFGLSRLLDGELWTAATLFAPGVCFWFLGYEFERSLLVKRGRHLRLVVSGLCQTFTVLLVLVIVHELQLPYTFLVAAMAILGLARTISVVLVAGRPDWKAGGKQFVNGMRRLGPGATAILLGSVSCSHAPVFALSIYGTAEQAAAFGAMRTLFQPMQIFFRSRDVIVQARFHADRSADQRNLAKQYWSSLTRTALLSVLLSLLLLAAGPWLVHAVFAGRFDAHMTTFWLWAVIMLLINLASITDAFVSYASQQNRYSAAQICAGVGVVVLSPLLAAKMGDVGAAVAAITGWLCIVAGGAVLIGLRPRSKAT